MGVSRGHCYQGIVSGDSNSELKVALGARSAYFSWRMPLRTPWLGAISWDGGQGSGRGEARSGWGLVTMRRLGSLIVFTAICLVLSPTLLANWQLDDVPVCRDVAVQQWPAATPDGFGGALIAWFDGRTSCIYAQRMNEDGQPLWGPNGVPAGSATVASSKPLITGDGGGGAYVVVERDSLYACWDMGLGPCLYIRKIFVSKLSANGSPLWQRRMHIPAAPGSLATDEAPCMISDGEGGVVLVWQATSDTYCWPPCLDCGCEWVNYKVLAQRIDSTGAFQWGDSHVSVFQNTWDSEPNPRIVSDGADGYLVAFEDSPTYGTIDVHAQRVSSGGEVFWGATVFSGAGYASKPVIASDGRHGAIIAWSDGRTNPNYYAQRIDSAGAALWPSGGVPVCVASGSRQDLSIVPGASGNAILSWKETRGGVPSIYAQRLNPTGSAVWTPDGMPLTSSGLQCVEPAQSADFTGGSIVSWIEFPAGSSDALRGIWGDTSGPRFAAGDHGFICRFENGTWSTMSSPTQSTLRGLWGSSVSDVFAVGDQGTVLHWNGSAWQSMSSGTTSDLYGVWGTGPSSVYAVGNQGTIIHFDGSAWGATSYSGGGNFFGISGTSDDNVIAVGDYRLNGYIATFNGSTWSSGADGNYVQYTGVWKSPDNKTFIAVADYSTGRGQGVIRYNAGGGWLTYSTGISLSGGLWGSLWGTSGSNVYALFSSGHVMRFDGASWSAPAQMSVYPMYSLWGTFGSDVYAAGQPCTVMHLEDAGWNFVCGSTGVLTAQRVDSAGAKLWTTNGAQITLSEEEEREPFVTVDAAGFATFAWKDSRNGNWDIYSRRVSIARGPVVGTLLAFYAATPVRGGIAVHWELTEYDEGDGFLISRGGGVGDPSWKEIEPSVEREGLLFDFVDSDGEPGSTYRYRVGIQSAAGIRFLFETEAVKMPVLPVALYQNVPNPFNPSTRIRYYLPEPARVDLSVYDVAGRRVIRLVDCDQPMGMHEVSWNGIGSKGPCAGGIYFCRLSAGKKMLSKKMVLLK